MATLKRPELDSALLVRLPSELHDQLRAIAAAEDRSMAGLMRQAAEKVVASYQASSAA